MFEHASQKRCKIVKTDCFDWFVLYKKQLGSRVMFITFCYFKRFCSTWKSVSQSFRSASYNRIRSSYNCTWF